MVFCQDKNITFCHKTYIVFVEIQILYFLQMDIQYVNKIKHKYFGKIHTEYFVKIHILYFVKIRTKYFRLPNIIRNTIRRQLYILKNNKYRCVYVSFPRKIFFLKYLLFFYCCKNIRKVESLFRKQIIHICSPALIQLKYTVSRMFR